MEYGGPADEEGPTELTLLRWLVAISVVLGVMADGVPARAAAPPPRFEVLPEIAHGVSQPVRSLPAASPGERLVHPARPLPGKSSTSASGSAPQPANAPAGAAMPALAQSFDGVGQGFNGYTVPGIPPDTDGAVGPNHYVQIVNTAFAIFDKSGTRLAGPTNTNTLWTGLVGSGCGINNRGDGIVEYDRRADRWVITQFSFAVIAGNPAPPFEQCVAVSRTGDPTGLWNLYAFGGFGNNLNDYGKLGVWPDAYYATFNLFDTTIAPPNNYAGPKFCAYDRTRMLAGLTATQQCFSLATTFGGDLPSDLDGTADPPAGSPNYFMEWNTSTSLVEWKFHVDWTTPANTTLSAPIAITVPMFSVPCGGTGGTCVPQQGTAQQLDTLGDRLMQRLAYRNFGDHESILATHTVDVGGHGGIRWYEIRTPGSPTLFQSGTFAPDADYRWMPSIAMDSLGDIAAAYSISSAATHPGIRYAGRLAADPAGTMPQGEGTIITGNGSQTTSRRWGDYSSITVDPSNDCTFWITNQYIPANGVFNWHTRIASFKFRDCRDPAPQVAPPVSATRSPAPQSTPPAVPTPRVPQAAAPPAPTAAPPVELEAPAAAPAALPETLPSDPDPIGFRP